MAQRKQFAVGLDGAGVDADHSWKPRARLGGVHLFFS